MASKALSLLVMVLISFLLVTSSVGDKKNETKATVDQFGRGYPGRGGYPYPRRGGYPYPGGGGYPYPGGGGGYPYPGGGGGYPYPGGGYPYPGGGGWGGGCRWRCCGRFRCGCCTKKQFMARAGGKQ